MPTYKNIHILLSTYNEYAHTLVIKKIYKTRKLKKFYKKKEIYYLSIYFFTH